MDYEMQEYENMISNFSVINAHTNLGRTTFDASFLAEDLEMWMGFISGSLFKPRFETSKVESERRRIVREIADRKGNSAHNFLRKITEAFYGSHPTILQGTETEDSIANVPIERIKEFHLRGYYPNNMHLVIGNNVPDNIYELAEKYFGNPKKGSDTSVVFPKLSPLEKTVVIEESAPDLINKTDIEKSSATVQVDFSATPDQDNKKHRFALTFIDKIIDSGGHHGLLFKRLSQESGLAYRVSSSYDNAYNAGRLSLSAAVKARELKEAVDIMTSIIEDIKTKPIEKENLEKIKRRTKYTSAVILEDECSLHKILYYLDNGFTKQEHLESHMKIQPEEIMEVAQKYLKNYVLSIRNPLL